MLNENNSFASKGGASMSENTMIVIENTNTVVAIASTNQCKDIIYRETNEGALQLSSYDAYDNEEKGKNIDLKDILLGAKNFKKGNKLNETADFQYVFDEASEVYELIEKSGYTKEEFLSYCLEILEKSINIQKNNSKKFEDLSANRLLDVIKDISRKYPIDKVIDCLLLADDSECRDIFASKHPLRAFEALIELD